MWFYWVKLFFNLSWFNAYLVCAQCLIEWSKLAFYCAPSIVSTIFQSKGKENEAVKNNAFLELTFLHLKCRPRQCFGISWMKFYQLCHRCADFTNVCLVFIYRLPLYVWPSFASMNNVFRCSQIFFGFFFINVVVNKT